MRRKIYIHIYSFPRHVVQTANLLEHPNMQVYAHVYKPLIQGLNISYTSWCNSSWEEEATSVPPPVKDSFSAVRPGSEDCEVIRGKR